MANIYDAEPSVAEVAKYNKQLLERANNKLYSQ